MNGLCAVTGLALVQGLRSSWWLAPVLPPTDPSPVPPAAPTDTPDGPLCAERALCFGPAAATAGDECACGLCSGTACFDADSGLGFVDCVEPVESVPAARPALPLPPPVPF